MGYGEEHTLDVLVENMGRVNYGPKLLDRKGAVGIRFGNQYHFGWDIYPLPMNVKDISSLRFSTEGDKGGTPAFLKGNLHIEGKPCDTFLRTDGFGRGFVTVNGFNLGRYHSIGPTRTLYVPAPMLREGDNEIIVFESDGQRESFVCFTDKADLG